MGPEQAMVQEFHRKYDAPIQSAPRQIGAKDRLRRARLIISEASEFLEAADTDNFVEMVDALADILVVTYGDLVARYGGEEFVVLLPETDTEGAQSIAEELRTCVQALAITHAPSDVSDSLTVSIGIATIVPDNCAQSSILFDAADRMLYESKRGGRNRSTATLVPCPLKSTVKFEGE